MIYLDHNATSPCRDEVLAAMAPYWQEQFGNPESPHAAGRAARQAVEDARTRILAALGAADGWDLIFTSGGTEADNLALYGFLQAGDHCLTSPIEHQAVLAAMPPSVRASCLPVSRDGVAEVTGGPPWDGLRLVSLMLANNETGALQPVAAAAARAHAAGALLHTDAIQAVGRVPVSLPQLDADLLSLSGHKLGGPKGVGALLLRRGLTPRALLRGGGQEQGRRAGSLNVPAIVGLARAVELAVAELPAYQVRVGELRAQLVQGLRERVPDVVELATAAPRVPNTALLAFPGCERQTLVVGLDLAGVGVGAGAACSGGGAEPSHVTAAMDLPPAWQRSAVRFSLGRRTTAAEIDEALDIVADCVQSQRQRQRALARLYGD